MIEFKLQFTEDTAKRFFESNGVSVEKKEVPTLFGIEKHTYVVRNPMNGLMYPLERAFNAVLEARTKQLLLADIDRLTIYTTLNQLKK